MFGNNKTHEPYISFRWNSSVILHKGQWAARLCVVIFTIYAHGLDLHRCSVTLILKIVFNILGRDFRVSACLLDDNSSVQHDMAGKPSSVVELIDNTTSPLDIHRVSVTIYQYISKLNADEWQSNMMSFDRVLPVSWIYVIHDTFLYERDNISA